MDDSIWQLPGPRRLLEQVAREVRRGRHATVVLPACRAAEESFVDGVVASLMGMLREAGEEPRQAAVSDPGERLVHQFSSCLVFDDIRPTTVADLLDHPDAAGLTAVLRCTGLGRDQYPDVARLLSRIALESRPRPAERRPRFVVIGSRHLLPSLPGGQTDVTFEAVWWWGRVTRWDVASRVAPVLEARPVHAVLREVLLETVVEVCRWDLDLAEDLAKAWDGDPKSLAGAVEEAGKARSRTQAVIPRRARPGTSRPDESLLAHWDEGQVDLWQYEPSPSPYNLLTAAGGIEHAVWAAQARVLLPWIEVRRQELLRRLLDRYGDRVDRAAEALNGGGRMPLEVGPLFLVTRELVPSGEVRLRDAARQLMVGRNRLAHLQTLSVAEQERLVTTRAVLGA